MILILTIAWCLLSIPAGILIGASIRLGLSGAVLADDAAASAPAGDQPRRGEAADVPQQRRPASAPAQLQDVQAS